MVIVIFHLAKGREPSLIAIDSLSLFCSDALFFDAMYYPQQSCKEVSDCCQPY